MERIKSKLNNTQNMFMTFKTARIAKPTTARTTTTTRLKLETPYSQSKLVFLISFPSLRASKIQRTIKLNTILPRFTVWDFSPKQYYA